MQDYLDSRLEVKNNLRYERKFIVPTNVPLKELVVVTKNNSAFFKEVFYERQVNNIYLDTEDYKFYFDNVDGVANRQKVRIRWYGDSLGKIEKPKLEIKLKTGLVGDKWTFNLTPFRLDNNFDLRTLRKILSDSKLPSSILELTKGLKPTLVNSYSRRYFLSADMNYRITLDYSIKYRDVANNINNFTKSLQKDTNNVVELKYSLKDEKKAYSISSQFPFRLSKNSKYVNGVNNFKSFPE
ncbi:VTC domain-containing protein [Flagellimonas onchidii]|uniref:VTC domain-containing protein n=1 Tax=Flagellimonas onchidii TaxID=2562684 RepID=UPI0010A64828|nr:VTC domain-containing protein [Allomuricauda onchidii]